MVVLSLNNLDSFVNNRVGRKEFVFVVDRQQ